MKDSRDVSVFKSPASIQATLVDSSVRYDIEFACRNVKTPSLY